jgi:hypothetical protein
MYSAFRGHASGLLVLYGTLVIQFSQQASFYFDKSD